MKVISSAKRCIWKYRFSKSASVQCREEQGHTEEHVAWVRGHSGIAVIVWLSGGTTDPSVKTPE